MADPTKTLYSSCVAGLGFICLIFSAIAVGIPMWGYFDTPGGGPGAERGYFGPWKTCKQLLYSRERCGPNESRFRTSVVVNFAGVTAAISTISLMVVCVLSVIQIAMINSRDRVVMNYTSAVIGKLAFSLLAGLLSISAAILFAMQTDQERNGFEIRRGEGFYLEMLCIALNCFLFILSVYDVIFTRRPGGDPTGVADSKREDYTNHSGFRSPNNNGISMTDSSGKPYMDDSSNIIGSIQSMDTMITTASSNGSTILGPPSQARSPLRSSLKKPRPRDSNGTGGPGGIPNPGFSGSTSPTLSRNGSTKKVRIQTRSTDV